MRKGTCCWAPGVFGRAGCQAAPCAGVQDFGDTDLLVVPVTSHYARVDTDLTLSDWKGAGLKLPSTVRTEKLGTIEKSCVARKLGALLPADRARVRETLANVFQRILG